MDYIYAPSTVTVDFSLAPAINALESLSLLATVDDLSGLNPWVEQTANALPPELRRTNDMIFMVMWSCIRQIENFPDFPAYLDWLAAQDPVQLRDQAIEWLAKEKIDDEPAPDLQTLIHDEEAYIGFVERYYAVKKAEKGYMLRTELHRMAHPLLSNPPALQELMVNHLRTMWETVLEPEWERKLPLLQEAIEAYRQMDYHNLTAPEAVRAVTGRDVSALDWKWSEQKIVFVPSPHIGPYISRSDSAESDTCWLIFGVRMPQGSRVRSTELSRSELNTRLSALADDTRLQILDLVTQHGELCAQDIINLLNLSQSAASRNLRQLTATGYLVERRRETAKCYSVNRERVDDTLRALRRFLRSR